MPITKIRYRGLLYANNEEVKNMSNCESCPTKDKCSSKENCMIENNPLNQVKKVIGVMSGKGGVGKSTVSVLLANQLRKQGYRVGILDADITGPSIPRLMHVENQRAEASEMGIFPVNTKSGMKVISLNLLMEDENQPVIWRGPLLAGVVKQFWTDVIWGDLDYLLIDMPPGTADIALTVMQSIPISGIVMVSVPQDLVSMIVAKAVNMARKMDIDVIGVVENMSYIQCPDCKTKIQMYDDDNTEEFLKDMNLELIGELPTCKEIIDISKKGMETISDDLNSTLEDITKKVLSRI